MIVIGYQGIGKSTLAGRDHRITIDNAAIRKRLKEIEAAGGARCQFFDFCGDNPERCKKCDYYDAE